MAHVDPEFIRKAIVSQALTNLALWDPGRTSKLMFTTGSVQHCVDEFDAAREWITGAFLVEAWSDDSARSKGGRPSTPSEKCTWIVRNDPARTPQASASPGHDSQLTAMLSRLDARLADMEHRMNGVDDDEDDDAEPDWVEPAVKKGLDLVERLADHYLFKGGKAQAAINGPAPAAGTPADAPAGTAEWMHLNRALKRFQRTNPDEFSKYSAMLLQYYGDSAAQPQSDAQQ